MFHGVPRLLLLLTRMLLLSLALWLLATPTLRDFRIELDIDDGI